MADTGSPDIPPPEAEIKQRVVTISVDVFLTIALISLFFYLSLRYVAPFVSIILWATILAVALHPVFLWIKSKIGGSDARAATALAVASLILILGPTIYVANALIGSIGDYADVLGKGQIAVPPADPAVKEWPLIGGRVFKIWDAAHTNLAAVAEQFAPQIGKLAGSLLSAGGGVAIGVLQFAVSVIFASVFLAYATELSTMIRRVAARVTSRRGSMMIDMAGATIQNVSRGVIGVAVLQGGLAGVGIVAVGLPFAGFLAAGTIMACIVQVPPLAIVPLIIWVWSVEPSTTAMLFTAYMVPVLFLDNVLKPILMGRGLNTPMIVILIGVIGGTLTSGLLGLFIGPVVLALFYDMMRVWLGEPVQAEQDERPTSDGTPEPGD